MSLPQTINVRVRYAETDKMGVVYYANYLVWFEVGRSELLRAIGSSYRDLESTGIMLPVIEAHCEYRSPARVEFQYEVSRLADGTVNAVGRTVHAAVDSGGKPCRLPDHIRELLQ